MRPLERFLEADTMTGLAETVPQFDILNRGDRKALRIEATECLEHRAAHRAASGPERRCLCVALLMDKMVQQVPILGHHTCGPRLGIVGTKHRGYLWMLGKYLDNTAYSARGHNHIGVHEEEDVTLRVAGAVVPRRCRSGVLLKPEHTCTKPPGHCGGIVRGGIVHHDDLAPRAGEGAQRRKALG